MSTDFGFKATTSESDYYFISYNTEDADRVKAVCRLLYEQGLKIWYDGGIPHDSCWESIIAEKVSKCKEAVFFITKGIFEKAKTREISDIYTLKEYDYTKFYKKKRLIVIMDPISDEVPYALASWWHDVKTRQSVVSVNEPPEKTARRIFKEFGKKYVETHSECGPDREIFTWENRAPYAVFNSIINNPYYGDERYFVKIREYIAGQETPFTTSLKIKRAREYEVSIYYHNNSDPNTIGCEAIGIADGAAISSYFPATIQEKGYITANIIADDTDPIEIWARAEITTDEPCYLRYIPGTAIYNCGGLLNGNNPGPDYLFGSGSLIGYNKISGILPGGEKYAGSITYRIFADYPDFNARISSWRIQSEGDADIYSIVIRYENIGTMNQLNVVAKAVLEPQAEYVLGSCCLSNNNIYKRLINDDIIKEQGVNIGDYAGGDGWAELEFKVATTKKPNEVIKIKAIISTADGNKSVETVLK